MGRVRFATYLLQAGKHVLWTPEADGFPALGSREHHVTANFREWVLTLTSLMSYRNTRMSCGASVRELLMLGRP